MRVVAQVGVLLMVCLGCGSDSPFEYVPVEGSVSYEDGTLLPAGGIQLKFISLDAPAVEGASPRPAVAHVNAEGSYRLFSRGFRSDSNRGATSRHVV